jgi:regulator of sigma E protease
MDILIKAGQLILSLSILVIIHEFGHFFFARLFNTRVEKFYLFFNPWFSLYKIKKGDTEYGIGWLPLGGYVKISGMIDESMDKEQLKQPAQPWEFRSKPAWQRLLIMVGGVMVNFVAAILIFWMMLFAYGEQSIPVKNATFGLYYAPIATELGLQDGDIVLKADEKEIVNPGDISKAILLDYAKVLTVKRGDSVFTLSIPEDYVQRVLASGEKNFADIRIPFVIDSVIPGMNASKAGLIKGDSLLSMNGQSATYYHEFTNLANLNKGQTVTLTILRNTSVLTLPCDINEQGKVGIGNRNPLAWFKVETIKYSFWEALPAGINKGFTILGGYVKQMKLIFSKEGVKQLGGFGTMGSLFSPTWDWVSFWSLTALLSIILAFMNILPIPALDGGHVIFLLYEMVTRRKPNEKFMEYAQVAGMILLLSLLLYANGMDIFRHLFNK